MKGTLGFVLAAACLLPMAHQAGAQTGRPEAEYETQYFFCQTPGTVAGNQKEKRNEKNTLLPENVL